jgi:hypothetical protein
MALLASLFTSERAEKKSDEWLLNIDCQEQVDIAFGFGKSSQSTHKPTRIEVSDECMKFFSEKGIKLSTCPTEKEVFHLKGLFQPASPRQIEILKHFKIPHALNMNKTMAGFYIKQIFSDTANVTVWNSRAPTSKVMQGLLFMNGSFPRGISHREAEKKLIKCGIEDPLRFREWKQIERLFSIVNDPATCRCHGTRKITWKSFYYYYERVKEFGVAIDEITVDSLISQIVYHQRNRRDCDPRFSRYNTF